MYYFIYSIYDMRIERIVQVFNVLLYNTDEFD